MNHLKTILLLIVFYSPGHLLGREKDEAWRSLSAHCQNLHNQLLRIGPNAAADPESHEDALRDIEKTLNLLVKLGELQEKKIHLKAPQELENESLQKIIASIEPLSKVYGVFVASEMCGLGARLYFQMVKTDEQVELHLRLPEKELRDFEETLSKLGVIANPEARKDDDGQ